MSFCATYIEDSILMVPVIENGVNCLGDLWDCHTSSRVGFNLFGKKFDEHHLNAHPIKNSDYQLIHLRNASDKLKSVKINGSLALELLGGLIKVEGSASYDHEQKIGTNEEELTCQYDFESHSVSLLPAAKEVLDQDVCEMLLNDRIKATHVVKSVCVGAHVDANIRIKQIKTSKGESIDGGFMGKLGFGKVSASVKVGLQWLDNEKANNHEKRITIKSMPAILTQPSSIEDMFKIIDSMKDVIEKEKHFMVLSDNILGVPIRFEVVPLCQFLEVKIERLYIQMKDEILNKFQIMLLDIRNHQSINCIKKRILEKEHRLIRILKDEKSPLTIKITEYEKEIRIITSKHFSKATIALKEYKMKNITSEDLLKIIEDFNVEFDMMDTLNRIRIFIDEGERELHAVHESDMNDVFKHITIFTNKNSYDKWFKTEKNIKLHLSTSGEEPKGESISMRLFDISKALRELGIEIGISLPSISADFSLSIKVNKNAKNYYDDDIGYVISLLAVILGMGSDIENLYHKLNAILYEIKLPLTKNEMTDVNELIEILSVSKNVYISTSKVDTIQKLSKKDKTWKFFVPIEATFTALEAVQNMRNLITNWKFEDHKFVWFVGSFVISNINSAPILIAFYNGEIRAICFDNLDILIFEELFEASFEENNINKHFDILSNVTNKKSFYSDRIYYVIEILRIMNPKRKLKINAQKFTVQSFEEKSYAYMKDALEILKLITLVDNSSIIMNLIKMMVESLPEVNNLLSRHSWSESNKTLFNKNKLNEQDWKLVKDSLQDWFKLQSPFLAKVFSANEIISNIYGNKSVNDDEDVIAKQAVNDIINDKECDDELRSKINKWNSSQRSVRYSGINEVFNDFIKTESKNERYFHLRAIISNSTYVSNDNSIAFNTNDLILRYIDRLPNYNEELVNIKKNLNDCMERKLFHQMISDLYQFNRNPSLYLIQQEFDQISDLNDPNSISDLCRNLSESDSLTDYQWENLWLNEQFLYLIRKHYNNTEVMENIALYSRKIKRIPEFIPDFIKSVIEPILEKELREHIQDDGAKESDGVGNEDTDAERDSNAESLSDGDNDKLFREIFKVTSPGQKELVESLKSRKVIKTPAVEKVLLSVDRKLFCSSDPYTDREQSIGFGTTISAPHIQAIILELISERLTNSKSVLDIGSGSGYLTISMAQLTDSQCKVIGIDHIEELINRSLNILDNEFSYLKKRVFFYKRDGSDRCQFGAPFDVINIGGAVTEVSSIILSQLKRGGRLIAPVGPKNGIQQLLTIDKLKDDSLKRMVHLNVKFDSLQDLKSQFRNLHT